MASTPSAAPPRDVDIVRPALLQRQADELAAALDFRPVVKLVAHGASAPGSCHLSVLTGRPSARTRRRSRTAPPLDAAARPGAALRVISRLNSPATSWALDLSEPCWTGRQPQARTENPSSTDPDLVPTCEALASLCIADPQPAFPAAPELLWVKLEGNCVRRFRTAVSSAPEMARLDSRPMPRAALAPAVIFRLPRAVVLTIPSHRAQPRVTDTQRQRPLRSAAAAGADPARDPLHGRGRRDLLVLQRRVETRWPKPIRSAKCCSAACSSRSSCSRPSRCRPQGLPCSAPGGRPRMCCAAMSQFTSQTLLLIAFS